MKYNELQVKPHRRIRRSGRGISAGQGKTAGRGTKGQKSRAGSTKRPGFAGGQNPLMQQLPKLPGFLSHRKKATNIYTDQLNTIGNSTITNQTLTAANIIDSPYSYVKLLYRGEINKKLNVSLQAISKNALNAVQQSGGTFTKVERIARPSSTKKDTQKGKSSA